jgi:hypothetical protein
MDSIGLKYEDLVQNPEKILRKVCAFLGEVYDPGMLNFAEENRKYGLEPNIFMGWKELTYRPITTSRVNRWRREVSDEDRMLFELVAGGLLRRYNYEIPATSSSPFFKVFISIYGIFFFLTEYIRELIQKVKRGFQRASNQWLRKRNEYPESN